MIKPLDQIRTWFSGKADGYSTVLAVLPYRGRYPQFFNCVLVLTAPRTQKQSIKMAYFDDDRK